MIRKAGFNELLSVLFLIAATVGLYFQFTYHKFLNNDTLSYINLAERYAAGDWTNAINGYWSPLYSWLLCLCKLAGFPLLQSCYVINFIAAGVNLYLLCNIAQRYIHQPLLYYAFSLYALLQLVFLAMGTLTPDLLSSVFGFWFLSLVTHKQFTLSKRMPLIAGMVAAAMYFSKLYNFIPVHLFIAILIACILFSNNSSKKTQIVPLLKMYFVFIFLCSIWIIIISVHEKKLVISTAGRFNHNLVSPDYHSPFPTNDRLYSPPFPKAYSVHTNPAHLLDDYDWSPFAGNSNFLHQLSLIKNSFTALIYNLNTSTARWFLLIASLFILLLNRKEVRPLYDSSFNKIIWFFVCYPLLYLPLFVLDRYVIPCILLFNVFVFYALQLAWSFINKKILMPAIIAVLVIIAVPFALSVQQKLTLRSGEYRYYKSFYAHLPQLSFLKDQSIASDTYAMIEATQFCYYLKCAYYSTWFDNKYSSLKQYPIRFLIAKKDQSAYPFLQLKEKMLLENVTVYIYEIK